MKSVSYFREFPWTDTGHLRESNQSLEDYCAQTLAGLPISASFGVACGRPDLSLYELLKNADTALYESKKQKGSISVYQ